VDTVERFKEILQQHGHVRRFYFGAGERFGVSDVEVECLEYLLGRKEELEEVVLEVDDLAELRRIPPPVLSSVKVVYVIPPHSPVERLGEELASTPSVKVLKWVDGERVVWVEVECVCFNSVLDPLYEEDEEV